jgi:hypothetical protein
VINAIITKIPIKEAIKKLSASFSKRTSLTSFSVLIEIKERVEEIVSNNAITDVNSSIKEFVDRSVRCSEVMMKRQKPKRLAEVESICCDVLLAIFLF